MRQMRGEELKVKKSLTMKVENTSKILSTQMCMTQQNQWNVSGKPSSMKMAAVDNKAVVNFTDMISCNNVRKEPTMMVESTSKILSTPKGIPAGVTVVGVRF